MFDFFSRRIRSLWRPSHPEAKIVCYHCGEKSRAHDTVYVFFDGATRPVCCYGCAAVLNTVEELGMHEEYRNSKITPQ